MTSNGSTGVTGIVTSPPEPGVTGVASPWHPGDPDVPNVVPDAPSTPEAELITVSADTLIDRPDLAEGAATLIKAGDQIPRELAGLPRHPAQAEVKKR